MATVIVLTAGATWTVPADWNNANNSVECIGGGQGGQDGVASCVSATPGTGGVGGSYAKSSNFSLTPGASVNIQIGAGSAHALSPSAGGDTWFSSSATLQAKGGASAASNVGTTTHTGGAAGGVGAQSGGGGGGAAGLNGNGNPGVTPGGALGGAGGSGDAGSGGSAGAGGNPTNGGPGGNGAEYTATAGGTFGSGGGGGGGSSSPGNGGAGGNYGAGGGGGGAVIPTSALGGNGTQGIIVITYVPLVFAAASLVSDQPRIFPKRPAFRFALDDAATVLMPPSVVTPLVIGGVQNLDAQRFRLRRPPPEQSVGPLGPLFAGPGTVAMWHPTDQNNRLIRGLPLGKRQELNTLALPWPVPVFYSGALRNVVRRLRTLGNLINGGRARNMYVGRDFDPANPTESEVYSLDFVNELSTGETISLVTSVTMTVFRGTDPNPGGHLSGAPSVLGTVVSQRVGGALAPGGNLLSDVTYTIAFTITTSLSNVLTLFSRIPCRPIK